MACGMHHMEEFLDRQEDSIRFLSRLLFHKVLMKEKERRSILH